MTVWTVLPAYNEEAALPPLLDSLIASFKAEGTSFGIIVVNDGSTDGTAMVLDDYARKYGLTAIHSTRNQGLAETMRHGLMEAIARSGPDDIVMTMDADNTHPAELGLTMLRLIRAGNDVVIASRYRRGSEIHGLSAKRRLLSNAASWIFRLTLPIPNVRDYTCSYRAYRAGVLRKLVERYDEQFISERGFSCTVDILLRLRDMNLRFVEVPLILRYDLKPGHTKMPVAQTILDTLGLLIRRRLGRH